jgi:transcription initiation factor TFIIIB Brf1 subunit/transcription initiation factor TFIIB
MPKDIRMVKECPQCAGTNLIYDEKKREVICKDCGLIYDVP